MIIKTTNTALCHLLDSLGQRFDHCFRLYPLPARQLGRLIDIMATKYAGQWSVDFDGQPAVSYEDLTVGVDGANWQAFMLAPGKYGGDTDDLINFIENVYGLPVDNENHEQVSQMFRLWFAATYPDKYTNPTTQRRDVVRKAQTARRSRLTQAANRLNCATIDKLAVTVLAMSDKDAATLRACLAEVTQKS